MMLSRTVAATFIVLLMMETCSAGQTEDLPDWVNSEKSQDYLVASTDVLSAGRDVLDNRLATVRSAISAWAFERCGTTCVLVVQEIADEEVESLIETSYIETLRTDYDPETAKMLSTSFEESYRGHFRVRTSDSLLNRIRQRVSESILERRLRGTLLASVFCFGTVGILWSYLYVGRLTRGFYISRLRWIAGTMFVTLAGICFAISQLIF